MKQAQLVGGVAALGLAFGLGRASAPEAGARPATTARPCVSAAAAQPETPPACPSCAAQVESEQQARQACERALQATAAAYDHQAEQAYGRELQPPEGHAYTQEMMATLATVRADCEDFDPDWELRVDCSEFPCIVAVSGSEAPYLGGLALCPAWTERYEPSIFRSTSTSRSDGTQRHTLWHDGIPHGWKRDDGENYSRRFEYRVGSPTELDSFGEVVH